MSKLFEDTSLALSGIPAEAKNKDIVGIIHLLVIAKVTLAICSPDDECLPRLTEIITRVRGKLRVDASDMDGKLAWAELTMPGLLRVLYYVENEIRDRLNDDLTATIVAGCVKDLAKAHRLSGAALFENAPSASIN